MRKALLVFAALVLATAVGCSNDKKKDEHGGAHSGEMIEVEITVKPEEPHAGNEIGLEAKVTQGGKPVDDADEVKFEIRKSGSDESKDVKGELDQDGVYTASWVFPETGTFFVTAHVTAHSMHNMPTKEVEVKE